MRISDLSAASGVSAQAIRFYERRGLLPPSAREGNGYRRYDDSAIARLTFIRTAQSAGLTLAEIGSIISIREAGEAPCKHVTLLLASKRSEIQRRQRELALLESELIRLIDASHAVDPATCATGGVCDVIAMTSH